MKTKVYKVVRVIRDRFFSSFVRNTLFIKEYECGKVTFPELGTKLFVFNSLSDADKYSSDFNVHPLQILEGEAENFVSGYWLHTDYSDLFIAEGKCDFINRLRPVSYYSSAGICDSFLPTNIF